MAYSGPHKEILSREPFVIQHRCNLFVGYKLSANRELRNDLRLIGQIPVT